MEGFNSYLANPRSLWIAPRGSGKSTVVAYLAAWLGIADLHSKHPTLDNEEEHERWLDRRAIHEMLFGSAPRRIDSRSIRISLTSSSQQNAKRLLWQVKNIVQMPAVSRCLDFQVRDERRDRSKRWTEEVADSGYRDTLLREATWTALGMGSKIAGGHYDVVFGDDWVTLDNSRTKTQRENVADFWKFTVKGTCEPWCRVGISGTRYHPKDWYGEITQWSGKGGSDVDGGWATLRHQSFIYDRNGGRRSYWPAVYSIETLDAIRDEIGSAAFSTQYMGETAVMEGDFFEREWLEQVVEWKSLPHDIRDAAVTGMALDMAFKGGPEHDWSVFTLGHMNAPCAQFPHGRFQLELARRGRWTKRELIAQAEVLYAKARATGNAPAVFAIEAAPGTEFLIQDLRESRVIPRGIIKPMPPRISKLARAEKARTLFEIGAVFLDPPGPENGLQVVVDEVLSFTGERGSQDDCVDSLVWLIIALSRGRTRLRRAGIHG